MRCSHRVHGIACRLHAHGHSKPAPRLHRRELGRARRSDRRCDAGLRMRLAVPLDATERNFVTIASVFAPGPNVIRVTCRRRGSVVESAWFVAKRRQTRRPSSDQRAATAPKQGRLWDRREAERVDATMISAQEESVRSAIFSRRARTGLGDRITAITKAVRRRGSARGRDHRGGVRHRAGLGVRRGRARLGAADLAAALFAGFPRFLRVLRAVGTLLAAAGARRGADVTTLRRRGWCCEESRAGGERERECCDEMLHGETLSLGVMPKAHRRTRPIRLGASNRAEAPRDRGRTFALSSPPRMDVPRSVRPGRSAFTPAHPRADSPTPAAPPRAPP